MKNNVNYYAYKFRLDNELSKIPLDYAFLRSFIICKGYSVKTYIEASEEIKESGYTKYAKAKNAFTIVEDGSKATIYINDTLPLEVKSKVLLHEYGHIYLNHTYSGILGKSDDEYETNEQEAEANEFAILVLAPPRLLKMLKIEDTKQISKATLIPYNDAIRIRDEIRNIDKKPLTTVESDFCAMCKSIDNNISKQNPIKQTKYKFIFSAVIIAALCVTSYFLINNIHNDDTTATESTTSVTISSQTDNADSSKSQSDIVYVTEIGTKYHTENCYHIKDSDATETTREEAEKFGYEACRDCMP